MKFMLSLVGFAIIGVMLVGCSGGDPAATGATNGEIQGANTAGLRQAMGSSAGGPAGAGAGGGSEAKAQLAPE